MLWTADCAKLIPTAVAPTAMPTITCEAPFIDASVLSTITLTLPKSECATRTTAAMPSTNASGTFTADDSLPPVAWAMPSTTAKTSSPGSRADERSMVLLGSACDEHDDEHDQQDEEQ